ncbi:MULTISPECIES: response regulator transcription factor [unclassified Amycolatopsis]|uniref:response regulator transcription factor n=1 Tax=unclassified Amycolatopsis TaxID=2618356 RepID=UPI002E105944|nr:MULTISPECIES: response regulator transcription factor [unclassified Amycolatopsis]WSK75979.1 response regulator transcription factor [Amycolatopsis sp. NBC_01286]
MNAPRILVVEDAEAIRVAVETALSTAGFDVRALPDGAGLEAELSRARPDLVVLDVMLPGRDGFELLRVIRRLSAAGVVMLTARDGVEDRLRGLGEGADDYVVKPFVLAELVARVTAVLRRTGRAPAAVEIGELVVDVEGGRVRYGAAEVELTSTEWKLLVYFARHRERVVGKTQILTAVWGYGDYAANLVEVNVSTLRRKLEAHGPRVLHTVRGQGYVLRGEP